MIKSIFNNWKKGWLNIIKAFLVYFGIAIALLPLKMFAWLFENLGALYPNVYVNCACTSFMFILTVIWVPLAFFYGPKICQVSMSLDYLAKRPSATNTQSNN